MMSGRGGSCLFVPLSFELRAISLSFLLRAFDDAHVLTVQMNVPPCARTAAMYITLVLYHTSLQMPLYTQCAGIMHPPYSHCS
jgi:hypothetical protein